jgi:hypothetical protein
LRTSLGKFRNNSFNSFFFPNKVGLSEVCEH